MASTAVINAVGGSQVESPSHYQSLKSLGLEAWDILDLLFTTDPDLWQAGKYLFRAKHKGNEDQDLAKAEQYIARRRAKLKAASQNAV